MENTSELEYLCPECLKPLNYCKSSFEKYQPSEFNCQEHGYMDVKFVKGFNKGYRRKSPESSTEEADIYSKGYKDGIKAATAVMAENSKDYTIDSRDMNLSNSNSYFEGIEDGIKKEKLDTQQSNLVPIDKIELANIIGIWSVSGENSYSLIDKIYDKFGTQQSKLVPLNKEELIKLSSSYFPYGGYQFIDLICSKYGSPYVPSLEDIAKILRQPLEGYCGTLDKFVEPEMVIAQAIHRLITNGGKK